MIKALAELPQRVRVAYSACVDRGIAINQGAE